MAKECLRKCALVLVAKWARAVICDSDSNIEDWSEVGRAVAKVLCLKGMVLVMPKDQNIGKHRYIDNWILRKYRKYRKYRWIFLQKYRLLKFFIF